MAARAAMAGVALLALCAAAPVDVATTREKLTTTRNEAQATAVAVGLLTKRIAATEARAAALQARITELDQTRRAQRGRLAARQQEVMRLLAVLQTLSRRPTSFVLAQPQSAADTARISLLLDTLMPQLRERTRALRAEIGRSAETRKRLAAERGRLQVVQAAQLRDVGRLEAQGRMLAKQAETLQELLDSLPKEVAPAVPRLDLQTPVQGRLIARFGARNELGTISPGITWRTQPGAEVIAPADGRVAFTGPFRTYGRIVIIQHADGVLSVLAGLDEAAVQAGQAVRGGDAIGHMGADDPTLYFEVRTGGSPVDPRPLLAPRRSSQG